MLKTRKPQIGKDDSRVVVVAVVVVLKILFIWEERESEQGKEHRGRERDKQTVH